MFRWFILYLAILLLATMGGAGVACGAYLMYDSLRDQPHYADPGSLFSIYRVYDILTVSALSLIAALLAQIASVISSSEA